MTSGSFANNFTTGYQLEIDWSEGNVNNTANTSDVTLNLYWVSLGSSYTISSSATKTGYTQVAGYQENFSGTGIAGLSGSQKKLLYTQVRTITHNSDGTASVNLMGDFDCQVTLNGTYFGSVQVSQTVALSTITPPATGVIPNAHLWNGTAWTSPKAFKLYTGSAWVDCKVAKVFSGGGVWANTK